MNLLKLLSFFIITLVLANVFFFYYVYYVSQHDITGIDAFVLPIHNAFFNSKIDNVTGDVNLKVYQYEEYTNYDDILLYPTYTELTGQLIKSWDDANFNDPQLQKLSSTVDSSRLLVGLQQHIIDVVRAFNTPLQRYGVSFTNDTQAYARRRLLSITTFDKFHGLVLTNICRTIAFVFRFIVSGFLFLLSDILWCIYILCRHPLITIGYTGLLTLSFFYFIVFVVDYMASITPRFVLPTEVSGELDAPDSFFKTLVERYNIKSTDHGPGDYVILLTKPKVIDPENKDLMFTICGHGLTSADGKLRVHVNTRLIMRLIHEDTNYLIMQYGNVLVTDDILLCQRSNLTWTPWGCFGLLKNSLQRLFLTNVDMDYAQNIDGYSSNIYPFLESGIKIWTDPDRRVSIVRDYVTCTTSLVQLMPLHVCRVQAKASLMQDRVGGRIKSALSVLETSNGVQFTIHESLAIESVFMREHLLSVNGCETVNGVVVLRNHNIRWFFLSWLFVFIPDWVYSLFHVVRHESSCFHTDTFKQLKKEAWIDTTVNQCNNSDKQYWYTYSDCAYHHIKYPKNCACNGLRAVRNRQLADMGTYNPIVASQLVSWVKENITKIIKISDYVRLTRQEWYDNLPGTKKTMNATAINVNEQIGLLSKKQEAVKALLKIEAMNNKVWPPLQQSLDPRLISSRSSEYNVVGGPRISRISKMIAKLWNFQPQFLDWGKRITGLTYFSTGSDKVSIGKWMDKQLKKINPLFYNTDYKRFDASTHAYLLTIESLVYQMLNPNDAEFNAWLKVQQDTNGVLYIKTPKDYQMYHKIKYFCKGTRKSGDQNTSIGNTIINVLVQLFAISHQYPNWENLLNTGIIDLLALGDDTAICTDGLPLDQIAYVTLIRQLGLQIQLEQKNKSTLTFCSSYFVPCVIDGNETHVLTQKLGRNLTRAYNTPRSYNSKQVKAWIKANAYAYMKDYAHIPFMHHWHRTKYESVSQAKAMELDNQYSHIGSSVGPSHRLGQWLADVYDFDANDIGNLTRNLTNKRNALKVMLGIGKINWETPSLKHLFDVDIYGHENYVVEPYTIPDVMLKQLIPREGHLVFMPDATHVMVEMVTDLNSPDIATVVIPDTTLNVGNIKIFWEDTNSLQDLQSLIPVQGPQPQGQVQALVPLMLPATPVIQPMPVAQVNNNQPLPAFVINVDDAIPMGISTMPTQDLQLVVPTHTGLQLIVHHDQPDMKSAYEVGLPSSCTFDHKKDRTYRHPQLRGERQLLMTYAFNFFEHYGLDVLELCATNHRSKSIVGINRFGLTHRSFTPQSLTGYCSRNDVVEFDKCGSLMNRYSAVLIVDNLMQITINDIAIMLLQNNIKMVVSIHTRVVGPVGSLQGEMTWATNGQVTTVSVQDSKRVNWQIPVYQDCVATYLGTELSTYYDNNSWDYVQTHCTTTIRRHTLFKGVAYDVFLFEKL